VGIAEKVLKVIAAKVKSRSNDHRNLVNSAAREPLKRFEPKLTYDAWETEDCVFKVTVSKVKVMNVNAITAEAYISMLCRQY